MKVLVFALILSVGPVLAANSRDYEAYGKAIQATPADPAIASTLKEVSQEGMRCSIEALVSFGNRNRLSTMTTDRNPGQGVLSAAGWMEGQFKTYPEACGGK